SNHLHLPTTKFPDGALDLSDRYRVDKHGNLIPLNRDGTPNTNPAPHEPSATERIPAVQAGDRELVAAGRHAPEATAHAGDLGTGPSPNHGPSTGADHRNGSSSGGHGGPVNGNHNEGASGAGHGPGGSGHDTPEGIDHGSPNGRGGSNGGGGSGDSTSGSHQPSDGPDRFSDGDRASTGPTGPMRSEQEAGVTAALDRAKMPPQDQQRALVQLRKGDYGAGIAEFIGRGTFDGLPGYRELLSQCKQKGMLPAVHQAMEFASDLQSRGVKDLAFEYKNKAENLDLDVLVKSGDEIRYGCQLKDVDFEHGIGSAAQKIAKKQLLGEIAGPKVAILDIHDTKFALTESTIKTVEHCAKKTGATFELRFQDGSITIPANGSVYP
ncbi:hypothetical protein AB0D98_29210, partial [Streptomyces sp. NPDC047987]